MKRHLMKLFVVWLFCVAGVVAQQSFDSSRLKNIPQGAGTTINIPLAAPGVVTLSDSGAGRLSAGTYKVGVVAVNVEGGESQFDPQGYASGNNSITIGANHNIGASWQAVPGAAKYHVYVWGPAGIYYQRFYETASTSITISTNPVGPVAFPINITPSDKSGSLRRGNYYFAIQAEFADGLSVDQTSYINFPVATVASNTGSVALSWAALTGATGYRVYVVSEQDGSPRSHTKYFTTPSNSVTVTGTETYIRGVAASQMHGDAEVESSGVGIFGSIRTISNTKNFFAGDIQIAGDYRSDASFQANRFSNAAFAGISFRESAQELWSLGLNGASHDLITTGPGGERMRINQNGNVGIGTPAPTSKLQVVGLPIYRNNAAAIAGGLTAGAFYRTGGDPDLVAVVH